MDSCSWETHFIWGGFENVTILLTYKIDFVQSLQRACTLYLHDCVANQLQQKNEWTIYFNFDTLFSQLIYNINHNYFIKITEMIK
jgi:hypothetical protein